MFNVNETLKPGEQKIIHKFEAAGLGLAPFRFTRMYEKTYQCHPTAPVQAAGICDYCGMCIRYCFEVESADKKKFITGCDCIHKVGDAGLTKQISKAERELRDAKNKKAREAKAARMAKAAEEAKAKCEEYLKANAGKLAELPHPRGLGGLSALDYAKWMMTNNYPSTLWTYLQSV